MIRRVVLPVMIVLAGLAGWYCVSLPLAAQIAAWRGDPERAASLDPLNASYHAAIGDRAMAKARATGDMEGWRRARESYQRAIDLNPTKASHYIGWAKAEAALLAKERVVPAARIDGYVANLRKAVAYDPNYYYTNAAAGYYILFFRKWLTGDDRNFAIYRLRYALELNPGYRNEIFSYVANSLGDYKILQQITPKTEWWQKALVNFLRDIDKWKYRQK